MIQAAPFIIPIAEALGLSVATLGMAKVTDEVNKYIQENPEQAQKLITTIMPAQGIASMFEGKDDDNLPKKIDEEKTPQQEPPEGEPDLLPELTKQTAEEVIRKEIKEKEPLNKIQTWDKFLTKEEVEKASKENNIPIKDFEIPALKKQITFRKHSYGYDILFDKKRVGELLDITQDLKDTGTQAGNKKTFNLVYINEDGYNQRDAITSMDGLSFAKEKAKDLIAEDLLTDTTDPSFPSLKEIFQNLKYDKKGEPIISEMERDKKADGGRINFDMGGIFSINPDKAVKFNLDGETINLNPKFFEMFMGPFMNDPEMLKRRIDDLKQEIRRNQKVLKAADGGIADLLKI